MKTQLEYLMFVHLFERALSEWPKSFNLELETEEFEKAIPTDKGYDLVSYKQFTWNKNFDEYVVKDLYELCESISKKYYGHPQELLMVNLHDKIFHTIWDLAKYLTYLELKHLRSDIIQQKFEDLLKDGIKNEREDWGATELQLIKGYFAANYPEIEPEILLRL